MSCASANLPVFSAKCRREYHRGYVSCRRPQCPAYFFSRSYVVLYPPFELLSFRVLRVHVFKICT